MYQFWSPQGMRTDQEVTDEHTSMLARGAGRSGTRHRAVEGVPDGQIVAELNSRHTPTPGMAHFSHFFKSTRRWLKTQL